MSCLSTAPDRKGGVTLITEASTAQCESKVASERGIVRVGSALTLGPNGSCAGPTSGVHMRRPTFVSVIAWTGAVVSLLTPPLFAQDTTASVPQKPASATAPAATEDQSKAAAEALQKAVQNPVASLISVPVQNNSNFSVGPYDRAQDVLNIQPVIPINVSKDWMLITRTIQPIVWQPYPNQGTGGEYGLGDMNPSFFLSPRKSGKLIWGVGPAFVIPTATNDILGQGKFSLGPSVVVLTQPGHWTLGALTNNVWSVAGSGGRPVVNQMLTQYFITYQLKKGWYVSSSPIITANWRASSGNV